ncbi:uncharacterized protein BO80DRAFT_151989 [Aspergillus ibericus CBS 121593]|uniref:AB hydrolase-1 domain-containing protein n=1 Tax=Aspergillus ibericus CBS 121593 TaxID=1448316 RepID=A0A395GT67_9EURO|nr:hypothetical protein BO80DRAFT_151989 [Aspergillus ibericus CBS 121593]RAK98781.1 hypothetical protein BO80DRAFT_151989 [Aspergillus ibericus CBS 121593]
MQPFQYPLPNNATVAGIHSIPPPPPPASPIPHRPLLIGLHGGCYDSHYFDATPNHSASFLSTTLSVPFVSIDRPSYGGTSSILPIPEDSSFEEQTGHWLHHYILPKLWSEIGLPNQCTCIVLLCHSLGVMGGIVAAALHAQDKTKAYPLGGLIASGMGDTQSSFMKSTRLEFQLIDTEHVVFPVESKDTVMFKPGTATPDVLAQGERLNAVSPVAEVAGFADTWLPIWKEKWAARVVVPVMFCLVAEDPFFVATEEEVEGCAGAFKGSARVDASLVRGAPHCLELSLWSRGWYARCFGFALECAASFAGSG